MAHAGGLDLDLHLARAQVDELDVVPDLEAVVADVAEQCSAHVIPLAGGRGGAAGGAYRLDRTGTRSSLTVRQMRNRGSDARCQASTSTPRRSPTSSPWSIRTAPSTPPGPCWPGPTATSTCSARSGLEQGDTVAAVLPNGVLPVEVYLAALQAGWYYVPINYRLSAPEIAYIIQDSGAKAIVSHERYAEVIAAAADEAGVPAEARLAHGTIPGFRDVEEALAAQPDYAARGPGRRRRHALHVGHHRQAQGREAQAVGVRSRRHGRAVHRVLQPLRHPPPGGPGAPLHVAELPHRGHDLRRQRAELGPPRRLHGQVGPGGDARQDRALPGHPHAHGADAVPPDAAAAGRREGQVRRVVDDAGRSTPRRRARSTSSRRCSTGGAR